jgi:ABC-type nitrate/sulfonate/bicarbonate transport system substrate-binding protein
VSYLLDSLGSQATLFRDEHIYTQIFCLVARPEFVREHPEQVKAVLEGLFAALDHLYHSRDEAKALVAAYTRVDPPLVTRAFEGHDFDVRLDQSLVLSLETECRWLLDSGAIPPRDLPDVMNSFYLKGLLEVRPQAVQIIRVDHGSPP